MTFNEKEFYSLMDVQKSRSKSNSISSNEDWNIIDESTETEFVGYDVLHSESKILKYRKNKSKPCCCFNFVAQCAKLHCRSLCMLCICTPMTIVPGCT